MTTCWLPVHMSVDSGEIPQQARAGALAPKGPALSRLFYCSGSAPYGPVIVMKFPVKPTKWSV
jgi:hypothetical protein